MIIKGILYCKDTKQVPKGSVAFIYIFDPDNKEVIGRQTIPCFENIPLEYKIEINNHSNLNQFGIRCYIENGEITVLASKDKEITIDSNRRLTIFDIELFLTGYTRKGHESTPEKD